jgi:hypothetical protein
MLPNGYDFDVAIWPDQIIVSFRDVRFDNSNVDEPLSNQPLQTLGQIVSTMAEQ